MKRGRESAVVVIGAGATGTCLAERLCAHAAHHLERGDVLDLHVVDPRPPGPGRTWRDGLPDALRAESPAADLSAYTGAARPGPSPAQWLGRPPGHLPTRSELGRYLAFTFERMLRTAPDGVRVHVHPARATELTGAAGRQRVELSTGAWLEADAVVLARGCPETAPPPAEAAELAFAARHGLAYLPPADAADTANADTADADAATGFAAGSVPAREPVLVRGMGRTFGDLVALLTVGRGGRFAEEGRGELVYLPSGDEPLLHVGSRRGVPRHARPGYRLAATPWLPEAARGMEPRQAAARRLAYAYYRELFTRHPARTRTTWEAFEAVLARAEWGGKETRALVTRSVPGFADRLHLDRLARPLHGMRFGDLAGLQRWMRGYLTADLERRADPAFSADLALVHALLSAPETGDPWLRGLRDLLADGPSLVRQAELRALAKAGVVTFLGAGPRVHRDEAAGAWRAGGPTVPGSVTARALVEARRPAAAVRDAIDPLLARLRATGECRDVAGLLDVRLPDRRLRGASGQVHARRFALGSWTAGGAGFDGPGGSALLLQQADDLARAVLALAAGERLRTAA
ncbi:FAD/NAD(P)-binding protein [Nonomuraea sp. NPDC050783]|uniref:FAD/NAD(P)-binding protein n=1 Tax=Nonomuraea sp. NPDC050783 TaxID=3154634 RepID=UPI0034661356